MATDGTYKIASLPAGTDLVARATYNAELVKMDAGLRAHTAVQTGTSTTAYTTDAPFTAYYAGMRFQFAPLYNNTAAATLAVNGLGAKNLCDAGGYPISAANMIRAGQLYWLVYDATLDSNNGGFYITEVDLDRLPYYSMQFLGGAGLGKAGVASVLGAANLRAVGLHLSPLGGINWGSVVGDDAWAVFTMRVNNVSGATANRTLQLARLDDFLAYQIDSGAITTLHDGVSGNQTGAIAVPTGVHLIRFFLWSTTSNIILHMADWLDADVVWAAGGVYY